LNDDDMAEFVALQASFADSPKSWTVDAAAIDRSSIDLSVRNPHKAEEQRLREPEEIMALDAESAEILASIHGML
jgi:type I restriction enzyme M protein